MSRHTNTRRGRPATILLLCGVWLVSCGARAPRASRPRELPTPNIAIGACTYLKGLERTKAAGFDYAELIISEIAALSDDDFSTLIERHKRLGILTPVGNMLLPATLKVTGPEIDKGKQDEYLRKNLDRVARLGFKLVVFGSGGARKIPDGFSRTEAFSQLVDFGRRLATLAQTHGIVIVLEPLNRGETNIINSVAEGLDLVKAIDHPHFQLMVDFFHFAVEKEDPAILVKASKHIRHIHIANPNGRVFPLREDEAGYTAFFRELSAIGYRGGVSVEAATKAYERDAPQSLALLRELATRR